MITQNISKKFVKELSIIILHNFYERNLPPVLI